MATATEEHVIVVTPFTIEADHPRMSDLLIQSIPGCRLRSAMDGAKGAKNAKGEDVVPIDQVRVLGSFPKTPGMQLHVNPEKLTYEIIDPLNKDEEMCERVRKWLKQNSPVNPGDKLKGSKEDVLKGKLDKHRMKTLCREMFNLVEAEEAKKASVSFPNMKEIEELPGNFLLNPGSRVRNTQPIFEKDFDRWVETADKSGV